MDEGGFAALALGLARRCCIKKANPPRALWRGGANGLRRLKERCRLGIRPKVYTDRAGTLTRTPIDTVIDSEPLQGLDRCFELAQGRRVGIVVDTVEGGTSGNRRLGAFREVGKLGAWD